MLDSLVRVSRRAARDDAKAEPTLASRFALAVAQSFANRLHCTKDQADRGRKNAYSTEHHSRPKTITARHGSKDHNRQ